LDVASRRCGWLCGARLVAWSAGVAGVVGFVDIDVWVVGGEQ
jgi:hypothetical protein